MAIDSNKLAFEWGRRAAHDLAGVEALIAGGDPRPDAACDARGSDRAASPTILSEAFGRRRARRYRALVERVQRGRARRGLGEDLTKAVARSYHRLLGVKDEWEVSRLLSSREFRETLAREFDGDYKVHFHIGAWPFGRTDPAHRRHAQGRRRARGR